MGHKKNMHTSCCSTQQTGSLSTDQKFWLKLIKKSKTQEQTDFNIKQLIHPTAEHLQKQTYLAPWKHYNLIAMVQHS